MQHQLWTTSDKDRPEVICDCNGEVVLGLCKVCGRGEIELEENNGECPGKKVPHAD